MKKKTGTENGESKAKSSSTSGEGAHISKIGQKLCDILQRVKDEGGRSLAELFIDLPSKTEYPDYYAIIKEPLSLSKIRLRAYKKVEVLKQDFLTLFRNARVYNRPDSQVYHDSIQLERVFAKEFAKLFPDEPPLEEPEEAIQATASASSSVPLPQQGGKTITKEMAKTLQRKHRIDEEDDLSESDGMQISEDEEDEDPLAEEEEDDEEEDEEEVELEDDEEDFGLKKRERRSSTPTQGSSRLRSKAGPSQERRHSERQSKRVDYSFEEFSDLDEPEKPKKKNKVTSLGNGTLAKESDTPELETILGDRVNPEKHTREYFVKWKGKSYLHAEWIAEDFFNQEPLLKARLNRYWQKKSKREAQGLLAAEDKEEELFPAEYCEVDRIIGEKQMQTPEGPQKMYLIKWRNLPYTDATWEKPEIFKDDRKIRFFYHINTIPTPSSTPPQKKFVALKESPLFTSFEGTTKNELRSYQLEGLNWLAFCWYEHRGSILADEMGLGKTVQSISLLVYLKKFEHILGPHLVVAPLSTIGHWVREFDEWTDFNVVLYQGNMDNREVTRETEFYYPGEKGSRDKRRYKFNVLLTTYEMVLGADWNELQQIKWNVVIIDEAQRLKNCDSKLLQHLRQFKSEHRVLLTGTPIQNNTQELWTLLNFIEPVKFGSGKDFLSEFGELKDANQVSKLHSLLRPHLLRRMKEDVEKSIPPKEETLIEVELTSIQKQYYRAILEKNRDFLNRGCQSKNVPNLINIMMQLRKVCNHPFLINGVEDKETVGKSGVDYYRSMIDSCGKLVLLDKLLPKLKEGGHKVLIFSQMIRVLSLLETYLQYKGYIYERLDGGIRGNERQAAIDRFCKPGSDRFIFLLCTRAGGLGINLTAADTVIIYDSDWNPQNDIQAQARCHRIGQTNEVKVYRLITAKTYERHMFERSSKKLGLDQAVLSDMGSSASTSTEGKTKLDKTEIDSLLKYGAYDLFNEEDNEKFREEDIDQILNRSSKVVWTNETAANQDMSSFSKASFQSSKADSRIELDDPNFWEKVLPEAKTAERMFKKLNEGRIVTPEQRDSFMRDLGELVREVMMGFREGHADRVASGRNMLIKIFSHPACEEFSEAQRAQLSKWSEEVSKPRRERKSTARFGQHITGIIEKRYRESSDEPQVPAPRQVSWSERERRKFHSIFMCYGPHRWDQIERRCGFKNKTLEDLRQYAEEFIKQCIIHADEADRRIFIECLETFFTRDSSMQEIEVELKSDFTKLIKRKLKTWVRKVRLINLFYSVFRESGDRLEDFEVPIVNKPLTSWWTSEEDHSLLEGIYKHGLGAYQQMRFDPELSFASHLPEMGTTDSTGPGQPQSSSGGAQKEENEEEDGEENEEEEEEEDEKERKEQEDNGEKSDKEEKLGGGGTTNPSAEETKKLKAKPSAWPANRTLESHARYLLETMRKLANAAEKERNRRLRHQAKQERKSKFKEERSKEWTKRELNEFRMALLTFGAGQWDLIRSKAGLHKSDEQIREQFEILIQQCKEMVAAHPENPSENAAENPSENPTENPEAEEAEETADPNKPPKAEGAPGSSNKSLTITMARRLLKRLQLFDDIRNVVLKHPDLSQCLQQAQTSDLPSWWYSPLHDRVLLEAFAKFGLSNTDWDQFIEDEECILYLNEDQKPDYNKQKFKYFSGMIAKEKTPLLKRLEVLRMCIMSPTEFEAIGRKKKRARSDSFDPKPRKRQRKSEDAHPPSKEGEEKPSKLVIRDVKRDADGRPLFPINAKGATVVDLGTVVTDRPTFHSRSYIWPVGFRSYRRFQSLNDPEKYVNYYSEIVDGGNAPIFRVRAENGEAEFSHPTSSGVWCEALCKIKKKTKVSVSGPEMFGFSDNAIKMLIQELPNADKCSAYEWREFELIPDFSSSSASSHLSTSTVLSPDPTKDDGKMEIDSLLNPPQTGFSLPNNNTKQTIAFPISHDFQNFKTDSPEEPTSSSDEDEMKVVDDEEES